MLTDVEIEAFLDNLPAFDLLIDARSPKEFEQSHIPSACNFYALNNAQHQEVGTMYKHVSKNDAKLLGARYICENTARHLQAIGERYKIGSKIGIYCAKGGLRSSSIAIILSHVGYQVYRLKGGYKRYRHHVLSFFDTLPHRHFMVLGGNTGCGKTALLQRLTPALDIEGYANHLGSSFGAIHGAQPSQKMFENRLFDALQTIAPKTYIFVEAESKRLGRITIPALLHERILQGFRVEVSAPIQQRCERILNEYQVVTPDFFYQAMQTISPYIKRQTKESIIKAYEKNDLQTVVEMLLRDYYDLVYKKPSKSDMYLKNTCETQTLEALTSLHVRLSNPS
jgi:tRNA 2-selenouridine synthase